MPLGMEVGLDPSNVVLDGDPAPLPKKGQTPFSARVYCDQMAAWIKMPLGMEVGLAPGHIVLDKDPAPLCQKGAQPPNFGPCLLWPNGWVDQYTTWYECRPHPGQHCVRCRPRSTPRGTAPKFRPIYVVVKRPDE